MSDSLKYTNGYLLICDDALAMTCCAEEGSLFWDAVPCAIESFWRTDCTENDQCQFENRIYIDYQSYCQGNAVRICECQRLFLANWDSINDTVVADVITVNFSPPGSENGNIEWQDTGIIVTDDINGTNSISGTGTLQNVVDFINSITHWSAAPGAGGLDFDLPSQIIEPTGHNYGPSSSYNYQSREPSIQYRYGQDLTSLIPFNSDPEIFADNIRNGFDNIPEISGLVCVHNNSIYNIGDGSKYFEVVFCSGSACGISHPDIVPNKIYLPYNAGSFSPNTTVSGMYGRYGINDYIDSDDTYLIQGTGIVDDLYAAICPQGKKFRNDEDFNSGINTGPFPHDGTQCCPQRGATIGPHQSLFPNFNNYSGYVSPNLSNLEDTVIINNQCYKINEFYFMVGKEGRFDKDWETARRPYINSSCNFTKHPSSGGCEDYSPDNCALELFLPQFHKNVPWGPFGPYFPGIENSYHKALNYPNSYIALNYPERIGWDYRPVGEIRTVGTWQETKEINIYLTFHRPMPWYIGEDEFDDINLLGQIDPSTGSDFSSTFGNGCDAIGLSYNCEGKTVGDFVRSINALRTLPATGAISGCEIFAFCLSSPDVSGIPASKIINVSSELFDLAKYFGIDDQFNSGGDDPLRDTLKYSGSDIIVGPHKYKDIWPKYNVLPGFNTDAIEMLGTIYVDYPNDVDPNDIRIKSPPFCRHRTKTLPEAIPTLGDFRQTPGRLLITDYFGLRSPWFRSIEGDTQTVLTIGVGSGIPEYITQINVFATGRLINITAVSGTTIVGTTGINTNAGLTGYLSTNAAQDINNVAFTPEGGSIFWPVVAVTGGQPFNVWLDDNTRWNPVTHVPVATGSLTPYNWSYVEPIKDATEKNILIDGNLDIKSFIRRRCDYGGDTPWNTTDHPLSGCVPISSAKLGPNSLLDCAGDKVYDVDTSYLYTYGCNSFHCKTEWYLKATRCACSVQWDCLSRSNIAHNYNHDGNSNANQGERCYSVTQPILYICEYNLHPQCDIPMLIKVPFQIWGDKSCFPTNDAGLGFECGQSDIAIMYADGSHEGIEMDYLGLVTCGPTSPSVYQSPTNIFLSDCVGWCQYIDPVSAERVSKEDIPREWPPTAYISERGYPVFCSVNPYSESIEEICNPTTLPSYNWDSIYGVKPSVPAKYLNNDASLPCMLHDNTYGSDYLRVITRPIVNPLTFNQLCDFGPENRIDINCATKCCNCEFKCNPNDGGLLNAGPYICPCYVDIEYSYEEVTTGIPYSCSVITRHGGSCICNFGCCDNDSGCEVWPRAYGGTYDFTTTIEISFRRDNCCGCREEDLGSPIIQYQLDKSNVDCESVVSIDPDISYHDFCNGIPTGNGTPCGETGFICEAPESIPLNCSTVNDLFDAIPSPGSFSSSGPCSRLFPGSSCGSGRVNIWCREVTDCVIDEEATQDIDDCGTIEANWTKNNTIDRSGISPFDGETLGLNGGGSTTDLTTDQNTTVDGHYSVSPEICAECPVGIQYGADLDYINSWLFSINYLCDYPNLLQTESPDIFDPTC